ncbi:MAG TPA: hypothetical protein VLO11_05860 [Luteolibacter sp.]|nr:hypothetical protein [Luteolibacter sp.]
MKTKYHPLLHTAILLACACLPANAANILSDTFDTYNVGTAINTTTNWNARSSANGGSVTVQGGDGFGTSNRYADFRDTSSATTNGYSSMVHTTNIAAGQVVTFSLDFIAVNDQGINIGFATSSNESQVLGSTDRVFSASLTNGSIGGLNATTGFGSGFFTLNTAYELSMVLNDSGATVNYANRSLADNSYDVWIRDLTASGSTYVGTGTFTSVAGGYYSAARSFNGPTPNYLIDNWNVDEGALVSPIPEPRAALLGGLGLLALLRRRRA